jgi:hypothetical protein
LQVVALAVCAAAVSAEPEAEADPSLLYAGYAGYAPYAYGGYGVAPYSLGYGYGYGYPYRYGAYGHYLGKREAEAEASADADAEADPSLLYRGYAGYAPYAAYGAYGHGYAPYSFGYGYGYPYAYGAYGHYLGKREAEAEADPSLLYAGYAGYTPLAYSYAPYFYAPRAASYQHIATPFSVSAVSQIHKREAEAEADPALLYAGYAGYAPLAYTGVAAHPGLASSFTYRSPQGLHALYRPYGYYGYY